MSEGDEGVQPTRHYTFVVGRESSTGRKLPYGYITTLLHLIKGNVGTGVFCMGKAYQQSGMAIGPWLMTLVCLICLHCQHILIKAAKLIISKEPVDVRPTFIEIVEYTYEDSSGIVKKSSKAASLITKIFLTMAQYGFCCVYFVFVAAHLKMVVDLTGWKQDVRIWMIIIFLPMLSTTYITNLKFLMPISLLSNVLQWIGVIIIFYYTFQNLGPISDRRAVAPIEDFPMFFGSALFAFSGITFIMQVRNEMGTPTDFERATGVLNVGTAFIIVFYAAVGIMSYWKYGEKVAGSVFLNLDINETLSQVTISLLAVAIMLTFTFHMYITFEIVFPLFHRRFGPFKRPNLVINLFKTVVCIFTYIVANITTQINLFIALVGAVTGTVLTMIIPASLELAIYKEQLTIFLLVKNFAIIFLGFVGLITGTILSVWDIVLYFIKN